ncbi:F0F1 ATP synthase subunit gamma [Actinomadura barringtoniae]|uniref:ATP synthase gamma chain n=1 Tax=Actinomadura barringtoniae TaxID=1427535 RepID=A0A939PCC4_9ACTN|nr:F0F1 ATP synthase subunit gamma [Actinomadura barringtoniae]MBO2450015.1 F0F1 ATP synthase subunit gamma [Actinomadura barringtoniae]
MAAAQLRALRSRIRSVKSTAKITRAQELIASARIAKAQQRVAAAKPYARQVTAAVSALISHHVHLDHPLLNEKPDASRVAVLMISSDRGFCGGYNHNVIKQAQAVGELLREQGSEPVFYLVGRKAIDNFRFRGREAAGQWGGFTGQPAYEHAAEIGETLLEAFCMPTSEGGVGGVHVVYTEFVSMLTQRLTVRRILPLEIEEVEGEEAPASAGALPDYEFEPRPDLVLDGLLKQYVNGRVWHMLLESAASEWAARRAAMMAATENAQELVEKLSRQANEARQEQITMELSEIVAGANALTDTSE